MTFLHKIGSFLYTLGDNQALLILVIIVGVVAVVIIAIIVDSYRHKKQRNQRASLRKKPGAKPGTKR